MVHAEPLIPLIFENIARHFKQLVVSDVCSLRLRVVSFCFAFLIFSLISLVPLDKNGPKKVQNIILSLCLLPPLWIHAANKNKHALMGGYAMVLTKAVLP